MCVEFMTQREHLQSPKFDGPVNVMRRIFSPGNAYGVMCDLLLVLFYFFLLVKGITHLNNRAIK